MKTPSLSTASENSTSAKEQPSEPQESRGECRSEEKTESLRTAPDEVELKKTAKLPEFILKEIRTLEGVSYYHGMAARDLVETKLTRCGDYLVRATDNRIMEFEFILSVFNKKRIHSHLTIKADVAGPKWCLGILAENQFDSIIDLVNFYKTHPIGLGFFLKRAMSKGKHMIAHDRIKYSSKDDLLGSGNFSDVFRGKMELETQTVKVALKNTKKLDELLDVTKNSNANKVKKEMIQEAEVMSQLRHANITAFFGMAADRFPVLLVIEFCNGGNLETHLMKYGLTITHSERMLYLHDTSAGLKYIHSMSITHRDIAARNCLISVNGFVKLSDFGMGVKVRRNEENMVTTPGMHCPARWMAPELMWKNKPVFSKMSDVWSLGILTYEIFTNCTKPFYELENYEAMKALRAGKHPPIPANSGPCVSNLLKQTFRIEPTDRVTAEMFHNTLHAHCVENDMLTLQGLTLNLVPDVCRKRLEHWDEYVPQVVICDKNGNEKEWGNAPSEMLANIVWKAKETKIEQ